MQANQAEAKEFFERALDFVVNGMKAQRAMIVYGGLGTAHGLDTTQLWLTAPISHHILRRVVEEKAYLHVVDTAQDPALAGRVSVLLAEIRSVLCIPLKNDKDEVAGLMYADSQLKRREFSEEQFILVRAFTSELEIRLSFVLPDSPALDWKSLQATQFGENYQPSGPERT